MKAKLGKPTVSARSQGGAIEIWRPKRNWFVTRVSGRFEMPLAEALMREGDDALTHGPVRGFHEWLDVHGFDLQVQVRLTAYAASTRKKSQRVFIAASNPMVLMAVATANLAMGGIYSVLKQPEAVPAAFDEYLSGG